MRGLFFVYSPNHGFEMFRSPEEAKRAAQEFIDDYRDSIDDGWCEEVEQVCWGAVSQCATAIWHDNSCDYELKPEVTA